MNWKVPLFDPDLGEAEIRAVTDVIRSKWLTMGERTAEFEKRFAEFIGCRHAIAVSNCTAALHLAVQVLDIGPGDEVICPALTFVATANAIRYCGATPIFADVESADCWSVSRRTIEPLITPRTRAVIVVHYAGYPCAMPEIDALARVRGIAVIEDVAHAPGATLDDRRMGAWGDVGCFSFFSNKNMTTGEGGMLTTASEELAGRLRRLRSHGMTTVTLDRHKGHAFSYDVVDLGYNYRMGELNAALGLTQLATLEERNRRRADLVAHYRSRLALVPGLVVPFARAAGTSSYHLMPVLLPEGVERESVMEAMRTDGIQTSIHYPPIDGFSAYRAAGLSRSDGLRLTHVIGKRGLTLPLYPGMSTGQVELVCGALAGVLTRTPA
jgi:dTDP-4-amino-4,6-dideoxygalactose transaminase